MAFLSEFLASNYQLIKALHIISFTSWMAGMFYLPRLFVYHTRAEKQGELDKTLQIMELKLLRVIMNPAMIATFIFGVALIFPSGALSFGWMHVKMLLVLAMAGLHGFFSYLVKEFAKGTNKYSEKFYRIINEAPTILFIVIVMLVVMKWF